MNVQRRIKMNRMLWLWWLGVISLGILLWLATPCRADDDPQGESSIVIYQVTYTDKNIQNLNDPPTTNKGILMVTRITRTNSSLPSTETVSTGNQSMEYLNPGRTQETQLQWDGRSWVSEVKFRPRPQPAAANPPTRYSAQNDDDSAAYDPPSRRSTRSATTAELREKMQEIMELLSVSDRALRQAEQQIAMAADSPEAVQDAEHSLAQARKAHQDVVTNMIQLKTSLGLLQTSEVNSSVTQTPPPDSSGTLGTSQAYDPNRPIVPPAVLNNNVAVNGAYGGYGWPGAGGWPYFGGNVSIQTQEPNPDFDVGPRVIVREQK